MNRTHLEELTTDDLFDELSRRRRLGRGEMEARAKSEAASEIAHVEDGVNGKPPENRRKNRSARAISELESRIDNVADSMVPDAALAADGGRGFGAPQADPLEHCIFPPRERDWDLLPGYSYNKDLADSTVGWFGKYLCFTRGHFKGRPFELTQWWQDQLVRRLFGVVNQEGLRQYRRVLLFVPKKVGKTELAAAISCRLWYRDGELTPEIYTLASDIDQADICFRAATIMIENNKGLKKRTKIVRSQRRMFHQTNDGKYRVLSGKGPGKQGVSIHGAFVDEVHEIVDAEAFRAITNPLAYAARLQPVLMVTSTAGANTQAFSRDVFDEAVAIQRGEIKDPRTLAYVWSAGLKADWHSKKVWVAVNPGLGHTTSLDDFRDIHDKATTSKIDEIDFRIMGLNTWIAIKADGVDEQYVQPEKWEECKGFGPILDDLKKPMYAGLDLGLGGGDLSCFSWVVENEFGLDAFSHCWMPEEAVERRSKLDKVNYLKFAEQGVLTITEGDVRDDIVIVEFIEELYFGRAKGSRLGVDKYSSYEIGNALIDKKIEAVDIIQTFASLNEATVKMRELIRSVHMFPGENPLLDQAAENAIVSKNQAGYLKLDKKKNSHKIDPFQALVNGVDCWLRRPPVRTSGPKGGKFRRGGLRDREF